MSDEEHGAPQQLSEEQIRNMSPEQLKELQKKNCIFCHIISGKVQSRKIYEDEKTIAILDINPANPGHILLMPKEHYTIMPQMPDDEVGFIFMVAKGLSLAALRALKAEGTNIFVANGIAAGQKSPHFMIHIIPRKTNDGVASLGLIRRKADRETLKPMHAALLAKLKGESPQGMAEDIATAVPVSVEPEVGEVGAEKAAGKAPHKEAPKLPKQAESPKHAKKSASEDKRDDGAKKDDAAKETKGSEGIDLDDIARVLLGK
jgi:histidine triad (HIT) family protein